MRLAIYIFLLILPLFGNAQVEFKNLQECIEYAREHNATIRNAYISQSYSKEEKKLAWSALLPRANSFVSLDDYFSLPVQLIPAELLGGVSGEFQEVSFGTQYNLSMGIEATIALVNASRWSNVKAASLQQEATTANAEMTLQQVEEQIASSYYRILLAKSAVEIARKNMINNDSLLTLAKIRLENGVIELMDYSRIRAVFLQSKQAENEYLSILKNNILIFKTLLGIGQQQEILLSEELAYAAGDGLVIRDAMEDPIYRYYDISTEVFAQQIKTERMKYLPELSLYGRYTRQAQRNEFNFFENDMPWFNVGVAGIRLELPLFTGLQRNIRFQQALLNMEKAQNQREYYLQQVITQDMQLELKYQEAWEGVKLYEEIYQLNQKSYDIAKYKYQHGVISVDALLNIYNEQLQAQNKYLMELSDLLTLQAMIRVINK